MKHKPNDWEHVAHIVIDHVLDGIITINRRGIVESFNPSAEKIFGYSADEVIGKNVDLLMPEPYHSEHDSYIEKYIETGKAEIIGIGREVTGKRKDGSTFPMDLAVTEFYIGEDIHFAGMVKDITERKETEAALEKARRNNFSHTVKKLQNLIFILKKSKTGDIVYTLMEGHNAQEIGLTTENAADKTPSDIFPESIAKELENYNRRAFDGENVNYEWSYAGKVFYVSLSPIFEDRLVSEVVGSGIDITDRKKMEEALALTRDQALEASELKSQFLANMSHEIRTPMNGIIGMVDMLTNTSLNDEQREYISIIQQSSQALLAIINDILDYSKMEAGKMTMEQVDFSPAPLVEGIAEILLPKARQKEVSLLTFIDPTIPNQLIGDPGRVRQVLLNLADNAIKFTEKGSVLIRAILKRTNEDGKAVLHFAINDTGIGLTEEEQKHLFQPFIQSDGSTTRKYGGTGLGLAISKRMVELMDGEIGVKSEKDRGSTFWFTIPFPFPATAKKTGQQQMDTTLQNLHVLIVNDHLEEREILQKYVSSWNMKNKSVDNGIDALADLQKETGNNTPYDIAIVRLENSGMDSTMFSQVVKQNPNFSKLKLILLTDIHDKGAISDASNYDAYLSKPVKQSQLFDCIADLVHPLSENETAKNEAGKYEESSFPTIKQNDNEPILLVEDNPMNRKVAFFQLEKLGYTADAVSNGREAVDKVAEHDYALILMDIQMPEMDGVEATKAIRRLNSQIPIIAMTANAMKTDKERYLHAGMDDYLSKPVSLENLQQVLQRWMPKNEKDVQEVGAETDKISHDEENVPIPVDQLKESYKDEGMVEELLDMFVSSTPNMLEHIEGTIKDRLGDEAAEIAHSLKGSAAVIHAEAFVQLSKKLEQATKSKDWNTALQTYSDLVKQFKHIQRYVQQLHN